MKKLGLIGYPLGHSFSKKYFTDKFKNESTGDFQYENYPLETIELLPGLIEKENSLIGLNVTIPYKQKVMEYINVLDDNAMAIGAVNTVKIIRKNKKIILEGYNTDAYGFEQPLLNVLDQDIKYKGLILGTGGASKAVSFILDKHGIEYLMVSRKPKNPDHISYSDVTNDLIHDYKIIINTSPLGMYPDIESRPDIPYDALGKDHILYDLVYNPLMTSFLKEGEQRNTKLINGLKMLHLQAEMAWKIWMK